MKRGELSALLEEPNRKLGDISLNTGGISRARSRLTEDQVKELFEVATRNIAASLHAGEGRPDTAKSL